MVSLSTCAYTQAFNENRLLDEHGHAQPQVKHGLQKTCNLSVTWAHFHSFVILGNKFPQPCQVKRWSWKKRRPRVFTGTYRNCRYGQRWKGNPLFWCRQCVSLADEIEPCLSSHTTIGQCKRILDIHEKLRRPWPYPRSREKEGHPNCKR